MTKEAYDIALAFVEGRSLKRKRTYTDGNRIVLHGSTIAWRDGPMVYACLCGWGTVVTRDRLNALCRRLGVPVFYRCGFVQYYGDKPIGPYDNILLTKPGPLVQAMVDLGIIDSRPSGIA